MSQRYCTIGSLPHHLYVWVDDNFILKEPKNQWMPAIWFGLVCIPGRTWGLDLLLECGAVYRNLPPHTIQFDDRGAPAGNPWLVQQAQCWDCYGHEFAVHCDPYLEITTACKARVALDEYKGRYLFSATFVDDGFTRYPEQNKEHYFLCLDNQRLTIQPSNHVLFREDSFTDNAEGQFPRGIRRQTEVYSCEP